MKAFKKQHGLLKKDLGELHEELEETKEVMRLNSKYINSCVRQFKRDKYECSLTSRCCFIYGKDRSQAHYITDKRKGVYTTMERISKLNPKYLNMVREMKREMEEEEDKLLMF